MKIINSFGAKLFIFVTIVTLFLASQFTTPNADEKGISTTNIYPVPDSEFIIGAFDNAKDLNYQFTDSMSFNTWHKYTGPRNYGWPGVTDDNYDGNINIYGPQVETKIGINKTNGMRTLMDRPIIQYLVSGQRIDYQCENIDSNFNTDPFWYYAFDSSININNTDYAIKDTLVNILSENAKVKYCKKLNQNTITNNIQINSGLRANRELAFNQTNQWMCDDAYEWYIMPRIKIDSLFAANGNNDNIQVCKIVLRGKNDTIVKEIPLFVRNFKDTNNQYNGSYKEMYKYSFGQTKLEIDTAEIRHYFLDSRPFDYGYDHFNKSDIQIYWSGKCDMWIDRVRIENRPAHQYLTLNDVYHNELVSRVNSEIGWVKTADPKPNYFYFEECQLSHFPMIKVLNKQIMDSTNNKNELIIWLNYELFLAHIPKIWLYEINADLLKRYLYTEYGLRNIVMGSYALEGWHDTDKVDSYRRSFHPRTLDSSDYNKLSGILSNSKSPDEYDTWLQEHFDDPIHPSGVNYSYISKLMFSLSKEPDMRVINCPQAHLWYAGGHKLKEPSNEELELQANLALTYNAKGLIWFSYVGENKTFDSLEYNKGIMDYGTPPTERDSNVYKQNKYLKVCQIDSMLAKRGPYMISFDPLLTKNCIYRLGSEREEFLANTFIGDVITYKISSTNPDCTEDNPGGTSPQGLVFECKPDRYL